MKRTPRKQGDHDTEVKKVAERLRRQGWNVKADLPGYGKPSPIGKDKRIPDVEATKHGHRKLIEVETPESLEKDREQQLTFRRHAGQKPNTTFDIDVTN
ncbi:hypothetical protein ES703_80921 [subsurface metagenome]